MVMGVNYIIFDGGRHRMSYNPFKRTIGIDVGTYDNFYQIVRGLNHEEMHDILMKFVVNPSHMLHFFDIFSLGGRAFDDFITFNSIARDSLYELDGCELLKAISKDELIMGKC